MATNWPPETPVIKETDLSSKNYDGIIFVGAPNQHKNVPEISSSIETFLQLDKSLSNEITIVPVLENQRLVYVPTGPIDTDYDDVRSFRDAAKKGVKRALKAGLTKPLLVLTDHTKFKNAELVTLLGVLHELYVPIQLRELKPEKAKKVDHLGVYTKCPEKTAELIRTATILESGRRVACDIGDADPERMAAPKIEEYVTKLFQGSPVKMEVIKDEATFAKEYPLFEAVNRGASLIERHRGRIIYLDYTPTGSGSEIKETLFLVGKGVTYDTGGADIKISGKMLGMSRDKCGAAAVAGFMYIVKQLQPKNLKVVGALSLARNSVGANCYVSDELIKARSGALVRVCNTDAEGRFVMADVLCKVKELAVNAINPHIYTVATLTGHAVLTVGSEYTIAMDNGPARKSKNAQKLQDNGEEVADPFEISTIRREDMAVFKGKMEGDDVAQSHLRAQSATISRGHQGPAGFLLLASGLDKFGSDSEVPLKYTHLDIAGSAGSIPDPATGAPVLALAKTYLF